MKTLTSLLILSAAAAVFAQRPAFVPQPLQGEYESFQRNDSIRRTLRLDRNGRVEIVTEVRNDRGGRRDDDNWNTRNGEFRRFGRLAEEASKGRTIRHSGRWSNRDGRIVLRMDDIRLPGQDTRGDVMELSPRSGGYVLDRGEDLYGRDEIVFRTRSAGNNWPGRGNDNDYSRLGVMRFGRDTLEVERISISDTSGKSKLTIVTPNRRFEIFGDATRRGDEVVFRAKSENRRDDNGTYTLRIRGSDVLSIRGSGEIGERRISFEGGRIESGRRPF